MKAHARAAAMALAVLGGAAAMGPIPPSAAQEVRQQPPGTALIDQRIDAAAAYLHRSLDANGRFVYRINLDGNPQQPRYNVLRHAGTVYALAAHAAATGSEASREAVRRAGAFLKSRHLRPLEDRPELAAIFSLPDEEIRSGPRQAKLGGTGLGLIALVAARQLDAKIVSLEDLRALGEFVLFMQRDDGSFHSKYHEGRGYDRSFVSLYYPGETILGLVRLFGADPDRRWLEAASLATAYLVRSRAGSRRLPNDHWLMIAAEELLAYYDDRLAAAAGGLEKERIRQHVVDLGRTMMEEQRAVSRLPDMHGSFVADGRSTPAATRLEGLVALYDLTPASESALIDQLRTALDGGVSFLLRCQILEGQGAGGIVRAMRKLPNADDSFNRRQSEVRIDYVQHALSALLGYRRILASNDDRGAPSTDTEGSGI